MRGIQVIRQLGSLWNLYIFCFGQGKEGGGGRGGDKKRRCGGAAVAIAVANGISDEYGESSKTEKTDCEGAQKWKGDLWEERLL